MRTLAIDTSHPGGSVAACHGGTVCSRILGEAGGHSRLLAERLKAVAREAGWEVADTQLVAVVRGPGSFTGLRVGVATAKALAWAGGMRLLGVSGVEVVARETARLTGWDDRPLQIAFDAGRGEVYAAVATADDPSGWRIGPASLLSAADWIAHLPPGSRVTGPALEPHAAAVAAAGHLLAPEAGWFPSAIAVAAAAIPRALAGAADDPHTLVPEYTRPSYADERRVTEAG